MLPAKILFISADISLTRSVCTCLNQAGFKVIHIALGSGALDMIHDERPNLVILDSLLPDYNSLAIIRSQRAEENRYHIPIILIGSNLKEDEALLGLEVGADLCLLETFHSQVFVARVRSLLRRTELVKSV